MATLRCPGCGHDVSADASACPACGHALNGDATRQGPPPALLPSGKLSPEYLEWARQTFNMEEFLAQVREIEETGGLELKDFIQELEQEAEPRD